MEFGVPFSAMSGRKKRRAPHISELAEEEADGLAHPHRRGCCRGRAGVSVEAPPRGPPSASLSRYIWDICDIRAQMGPIRCGLRASTELVLTYST